MRQASTIFLFGFAVAASIIWGVIRHCRRRVSREFNLRFKPIRFPRATAQIAGAEMDIGRLIDLATLDGFPGIVL